MKNGLVQRCSLIGVLSLFATATSFSQPDPLPATGVIPDRYIVVLKRGVNGLSVASRHAVLPDHVYSVALNGFAGFIPDRRLRMLQNDPDVAWVEPDQVATIVGKPSPPPVIPPPPQVTPAGIARIGVPDGAADFRTVGIAIIDSGIDLDHPDLNVVGNTTFVFRTRTGDDDNGHGTHCAGIAAAKYNTIGVRGVAPNARLFAVKVLNRSGTGSYSAIIAGVDWVAARASAIHVANMSLGGPSSPTLNAAISGAAAKGIAFCVAAGNEAMDAANTSPANCADALAVSAIVDTDGKCGGLGAATAYGEDDTFASFSNYGPFVHIAAPGVNIYSTYKGGGYATMSGTSMAAPHVAGAAARYIAGQSSRPSANAVYSALTGSGISQTDPCGFTGDRDDIAEPLLQVAQ
jgi:subtilisin family serine protease